MATVVIASPSSECVTAAEMHILIVEDNVHLAGELAGLTMRAGFTADVAGSLREARETLAKKAYLLALIDRGLPDGDGAALASDIRRLHPGARVMLLTALAETREKIEGLDAGADDYLTKPFEPDELMARIRACVRRAGDNAAPPLTLANLRFSVDTREVRVDDLPLVLQKRELALLESLLRRSGRVALRESIADDVFGKSDDVNWHTLAALVSQLRTRLKEAGAAVEIHTARGLGYFISRAEG